MRLALRALSVIGYALCLLVLFRHGLYGYGGEGGGDVYAYWIAGQHVAAGDPVYGAGIGGHAAFLYPPPFAQVFVPLGVLPFAVAAWLWRGVELVALRVAVGSWRNAGLAMFWLPVIAELDAGNVHLILAAAVAMAIRGDGRAVLPAALTKFASVAALPRAATRDLNGAVVGAISDCCHLPGLIGARGPPWIDYLSFIGQVPVLDSGWYHLGAGSRSRFVWPSRGSSRLRPCGGPGSRPWQRRWRCRCCGSMA